MRLSDLITRLEAMRAEMGDLPVYVTTDGAVLLAERVDVTKQAEQRDADGRLTYLEMQGACIAPANTGRWASWLDDDGIDPAGWQRYVEDAGTERDPLKVRGEEADDAW